MIRQAAVLRLGCLGWALAAVAAPRAAPPGDRPSVVLLVIDTARADRFSCYGDPRGTTPAFDAFARSALLFSAATSTSSWTVPSHASMFTGLYPITHQAHQETEALAGEFTTLAEILSAQGYETAAFSSNPWVSARSNLVQGFEIARVFSTGNSPSPGSPHPLNRAVLEWLDTRSPERPFFLFVNWIEPHFSYLAPPPWQRRFVPDAGTATDESPEMFPMTRWYLERDRVDERLLPRRAARYDAEIAWTDAVLEELLAGLARRVPAEERLTIVTADHGENLGEHGHVAHVFSLYETTLHVPLAVQKPGGTGRGDVRADPTQLVDLFPTILAACLAPVSRDAPGVDLLRARVPADRPVLAEYYYPDQVLGSMERNAAEREAMQPHLRRLRSLRIGDHKLIWSSDGAHELYDLRTDPGELENRAAADPGLVAELRSRLDAVLQSSLGTAGEPPEPVLDPEIEEQLRALGYVK
jgi:arylsulfatase A-like enzyme